MTLPQHKRLNVVLTTLYAAILCLAFAFVLGSIGGCSSPAGSGVGQDEPAATIISERNQRTLPR